MATILGHDLSDIEFWAQPWSVREDVFRALRAERPIAFFEEPEIPGFERGPGYYAVTRHADIVEMSRRPEVFCSGQGAVSVQDLPPIMTEFYGSMISLDDPRHARLRGIVSRAYAFDVGRDPNPHIGFGAPGPHFCLGAHLARREITVMFRELFTRLPDLEVSGPAAPLRSDFINGIKHLPVTFTPR